jgi:hypothetical protein
MPILLALLRAEPHLGRNFIASAAAAATARGQGCSAVKNSSHLQREAPPAEKNDLHRVCTKASEAADNGQQVISQNR